MGSKIAAASTGAVTFCTRCHVRNMTHAPGSKLRRYYGENSLSKTLKFTITREWTGVGPKVSGNRAHVTLQSAILLGETYSQQHRLTIPRSATGVSFYKNSGRTLRDSERIRTGFGNCGSIYRSVTFRIRCHIRNWRQVQVLGKWPLCALQQHGTS